MLIYYFVVFQSLVIHFIRATTEFLLYKKGQYGINWMDHYDRHILAIIYLTITMSFDNTFYTSIGGFNCDFYGQNVTYRKNV